MSTVTNLWRTAPWWRFCAFGAFSLTLLFLLYPPQRGVQEQTKLPVLEADARYSAPAIPAPPLPTPAPVPVSAPVTAAIKQSSSAPSTIIKASSTPNSSPPPTVAASQSQPAPSIAMAGASANNDISGLDRAVRGNVLRHSIVVNGFKIELPPGDWTMLANGTVKGTDPGNLYMLGRIEHLKLVGLISITAQRPVDPSQAKFSDVPGCRPDATDKLFVVAERNEANEGVSCWIVSHLYTTPLKKWPDKTAPMPPLMRAAAGDLESKGVSYNQDLAEVIFDRAEKWGILEVTYYFDPATEGISSNMVLSFNESDWAPNHIGRFPDKVAYVAKLKAWADERWPSFKQAFEDGK